MASGSAKKALDAAVAEEETALDNLEANKDAINKKEIEINTLQAKISSIVTHSKDEVKIILHKIFTLYGVNQYSTWEEAYIAHTNALLKNIELLNEVNTRVVEVSNEDASLKQRERYVKENKDSTKTSDLEAKVAEVKRNKEKADNDLKLAKEAIENHKAVLSETNNKLIPATAAWKAAQTLSSVIKEEAKKDLVEKVTTALKPLGEGNENETKETVAHLELKEKEQNAERLYDIAHGKWGDKDIELETINTLIDEAWTPNDKTKAKADLIKQYQVAYNEELAAQATVTELETELNEGESSSNVWWWTIGSILVIAILGAVGFFIYKKKFSSVDVSSDSKNRQLAELA